MTYIVDLDIDLILKMYWEDGLSMVRIAEILNTSYSTIYRRIEESDAVKSHSSWAVIHIDEDLLYDLYIVKNWSSYQIAKYFGVGLTTIKRRINDAGFARKCGARAMDIDQEVVDQIIRMHVVDEMPMMAISQKIDLGYKIVNGVLHEAGVARTPSEANLLKWSDPEYKDKQVRAIMLGANLEPNPSEQFLIDLLDERFPGEWKYVGDGSFVVGGRNPDFMHTNGKRLLIEKNGCRYHACEECGWGNVVLRNGMTTAEDIRREDAEKLEIFDRHGFKTLVVWDHEFGDVDLLVDKIALFQNVKLISID